MRWPIDDISDVPRFFRKKYKPLFFLTVISSGNVFSIVITSRNVFPPLVNVRNTSPIVITVGNTLALLVTVGKSNGSSFFPKKRGTSEMSSMSHRKDAL